MLETKIPQREELVRRATELLPLLRSKSLWIEENRRLPQDLIEAIEDSGLLKMRVPAQYGGYESDARTLIDVHAELARGDGSAAFCVSVWSLLSWIAGLFPDHVIDEVFAEPNVRVCGTLAASGTAVPVAGGYQFSGEWRFNSGVLHSHWKFIASLPVGDQAQFGPVTALVPVSSLQLLDDWHTVGLRGSGSVTAVAQDLFVSMDWVIPTSAFFTDQCKSEMNASKAMYQVPMLVTSTAATAGQVVGAAKYAIESFLERMPGRAVTYTHYTSLAEAPITHLQLGEAMLLTEEAEARAHRFADLVDTKAMTNEPWTVAERVRSRVEMGRIAQLAKSAIDIVAGISGGSSIYDDVPIQRIQRDVHTISMHALTNPHTNTELYGRLLCGLEPNTDYM